MPSPTPDPVKEEQIWKSHLARMAQAKQRKKFKWVEVFSYTEPLGSFAIFGALLMFELLLKSNGTASGVSTYFYFILFGAVWIARIECKIIAQSKKLDELREIIVVQNDSKSTDPVNPRPF
eukprot:gene17736-21696_t